MRIASYLFVFVLAGCGARQQSSGVCDSDDPPAACSEECDPAGAATCPTGFHCGTDGLCTAECTAGGSECAEGSFCSADGVCTPGNPVDEACKHIDVVIAVDNSS